MMRHTLICRRLLLVAILIGIGHPPGAARAGEPKASRSQTTQSNTQLYVAIMGQVGRPGVFELPSPLPQLAEFLNLAGGITPNASGSIRVIRGGRSSQFFLSAKLSLQLIRDDLVIVESKQFVAGSRIGNTTSANGWQRNAGALSAAPAPAVVQIGLVNLISRPVILDIPNEQASLAQVLSLLHQPVTDKGEITVIKPGSGVQNVSLDQAFEATLATGMVLVFDPATVNSAVLPRLPNTIRPEANTATAITKTSAESAVSQTTVSETGLKAQADPAGHRSSLVPQATLPDVSDPGSPSSNPESVEVSPADPLMGTNEPSPAAGRSADAPAASHGSQASPEMTDKHRTETDPVAALARPAFSIPSLVMLTGIVACCLGVLLLARFKHRAQSVATPLPPEPIKQHDDSLESLISGALPVVEEPLQLPYEFEIFGRPLETSQYRTDFAQAVGGPHYLPQPSSLLKNGDWLRPAGGNPEKSDCREVPVPFSQQAAIPPTTDAAVVAEQAEGPASTSGDRKVRVDMRHPRGTITVLDRALATFEGEQP